MDFHKCKPIPSIFQAGRVGFGLGNPTRLTPLKCTNMQKDIAIVEDEVVPPRINQLKPQTLINLIYCNLSCTALKILAIICGDASKYIYNITYKNIYISIKKYELTKN